MSLIPQGQTLFTIDITYLVPLTEIEPLLDDHMDFIRQGFADGIFLMAGAKVPRTGGMIIATAPARAAIETLMAQDPFCIHGAVSLEITEFKGNTLADALK